MTRASTIGHIDSVQIYVARDGRQIGDYGEDQLRSLYEQGQLLPTDYYWRDGMSEWSTLGQLLRPAPAAAMATSLPEGRDEPSPGWLVPGLSVGGALFVGLCLLGFLHYHYDQKLATRRVTDEMKNLMVQEHQQSTNSAGPIDPAKFSGEMKKIEDLSKGQEATERMLTEETVSLLKNVTARSQACHDAEKDMLALGFTPARLTSVAEIDKRRAAIQGALPVIQTMLDYVTNLDATIRTDLVAKGVATKAADDYITGMHRSGKTEALVTYWRQEASITNDLLANLDLLKNNYGSWHLDQNKVVFKDTDTLALYQGNVEKLKADIAAQQASQTAIEKSTP